jgi:hypothetical protein
MNPDKTEEFDIGNGDMTWKKSKKLGTLLGEEAELVARKSKAEQVLSECKVFWNKKHGMSNALKIRLFKVLIESVLLYNCGTWALNNSQLDSLDAFYRGMTRRVVGIFYPNKISCNALYKRTGIDKLGPKVAKARILLFGKILRGDANSPGLFWLREFFRSDDLGRRRGRTALSLVQVLKNDLKLSDVELETMDDLDRLITIARHNGDRWSSIVERIIIKANEVQIPRSVHSQDDPPHQHYTRSRNQSNRVHYLSE